MIGSLIRKSKQKYLWINRHTRLVRKVLRNLSFQTSGRHRNVIIMSNFDKMYKFSAGGALVSCTITNDVTMRCLQRQNYQFFLRFYKLFSSNQMSSKFFIFS